MLTPEFNEHILQGREMFFSKVYFFSLTESNKKFAATRPTTGYFLINFIRDWKKKSSKVPQLWTKRLYWLEPHGFRNSEIKNSLINFIYIYLFNIKINIGSLCISISFHRYFTNPSFTLAFFILHFYMITKLGIV